MKYLFALCCFLATALLSPCLTAGEWFTDFEKAKAESAKTGRPIYILFTNPDAAISLSYERNIFSQRKFKDYADKKLVLMKVEFPVAIHKQQKSLRDQNSQLKSEFGISFLPTALLLDANGKLFADFVKSDGGMEKHRRKFNEIMDFDPPKRYTEYVDGFVKKYVPPKAEAVSAPVQEAKKPAKASPKKPAKTTAKKPDDTQKPEDGEIVAIPVENGGVPLVPIDPEGNFQDWLKRTSSGEDAGAAPAEEAKEPAEETKEPAEEKEKAKS